MRDQGLGSWPVRRARKTPDDIALVHEDRSVTYARLRDRVVRLAHALRRAGVGPGDRVAYLGFNHPSFLETLFATGMLGGVFVPLNARLAGPEIAYQLTDSGTSVLVHAQPVDDLPVTTIAREELDRLPEADEPIDSPVALDDPCMIMYTSGTTGRPKGAVLTHGNITWNAVNVLIDHDLIAREVALVSAPLFHTAGLNMLTLPVLLKGGTCVLTAGFDPDATFDLIERHRVTFMFGVPAMFQAVARSPRWTEADLSSLRLLTCGGAPVPPSLIATYQERGLTFLQGYGMTEAAPGTLFLDAAHAVAKAGSAGVPHFFTDVKVVAPGGLDEVPPGETGEVVVDGPHVMSGYWELPEETARAFTDGWFRTGDAARLDADGYAYIVDRIKDVIISGGENVYPAEVENALLADPDVVECAVIGVPDERWGETGRAIVVPREGSNLTAERLLGSLAERLARYKLPTSVVFTDEIPRNGTGKILKARLRAMHGGAQ
ncbi:acyl-CoA synthetase [Actinoallomurus sp. CA-142502]|uniref:acyl-CoA synthetase n=1 Tax=Actinoallomurus sp. CA-142502 TaxID=3239885 RepID=UPI003D903C3A